MVIRNTGSRLKTPWAEIKPRKKTRNFCMPQFLCKLGIATKFLLVVLPDRIFCFKCDNTHKVHLAWVTRSQCSKSMSLLERYRLSSTLKETNPEYSLEGLGLKLKLQYLDHLMPKADSLEKTLMLGKTDGKRRR